MERKVIQLAGKTFVVSLPSKWAKKYGVKKGDTIFVEEKEKELSVRTEKEIQEEKMEIQLKGPDEFIRRNVDVAYKKGVNELNLKFENTNIIKSIDQALETTLGFEIISQTNNSCSIKSVTNVIEEEFDNMLRRVFLTILSISEESHEAFMKKDTEKFIEIAEQDKKINKLTNFCKRILNKNGYNKSKLTNYVYSIVWELERIGDEYKKICEFLSQQKNITPGKDIVNIYEEVNQFLRTFYELYYNFKQEKGIELTKNKSKLSEKINDMLIKKKGNDIIVLHHLLNIVTSTYDIAGPLYAMKL